MKKLIIAVVCLVVLGLLYYMIRQHGAVSLSFMEGKWVVTERGDLVRPITASGKIEPASIVQIKGKASGEVVETPFKDGATVHKGDLIIKLDPIDEQRNVDRAQSDYDRAVIALTNANLTWQEREEVGVPGAKAKKGQTEARFSLVESDFKHQVALKSIREADGHLDAATEREYKDAESRLKEAEAVVEGARVEIRQAELARDMAAEEIKAAGKTRDTANMVLEDAQQRFKETTVYSPIDGMVLVRHVQIGEVVQSGKTSLTGGTVLMEIAGVSDIYAVVNVDEADIGDVRELAPPSAVPGYTGTRPAGAFTASAPATQEAPLATLPEGTFDKTEKVDVTIETFPQEKFTGVIERIAPQSQIVQAIATFKVWIRITSENRNKLVGLLNTQCEAHFKVRSVLDAILVDYDAIRKDPNSERYGVYLVTQKPGTGKPDYKFKTCKFGIDNGDKVEVIEGLKVGEKVWTQLPQQTEKEKQAEEQAAGKKKKR